MSPNLRRPAPSRSAVGDATETAAAVLRQAADAMALAHRRGGNQVTVYGATRVAPLKAGGSALQACADLSLTTRTR